MTKVVSVVSYPIHKPDSVNGDKDNRHGNEKVYFPSFSGIFDVMGPKSVFCPRIDSRCFIGPKFRDTLEAFFLIAFFRINNTN